MGEQIRNFKHKRETKLSSINSTKARKEKIKTNKQTNKLKTKPISQRNKIRRQHGKLKILGCLCSHNGIKLHQKTVTPRFRKNPILSKYLDSCLHETTLKQSEKMMKIKVSQLTL